MKILEMTKNIENQIINWRRELHKIPEIGNYLPLTRNFIIDQLEKIGVKYKLYDNSSGIEVLIKGRSNFKTVMIRCDMDALPVKELTDIEFKSTNNNMHACAHDAHSAMLLGAIFVLNKYKDQINGNIKCIFQPGEEGFGGAKAMIKEGVLNLPTVDYVLGIHLTNNLNELKPGDVGLKKGVLMASSDSFQIKIEGKGGHAANPELTINPIFVASKITLEIFKLANSLPERQKVITNVTSFNSGNSDNTVSDFAYLKGTIRARSEVARQFLKESINKICSDISSNNNANYELKFLNSTSVLYNDEELTEKVNKSIKRLFNENYVLITSDIMASEDISEFFLNTKGCYIHIGCGFSDNREIFPLHNAKFELNESVLYKGTALLAQSALDILEKNI